LASVDERCRKCWIDLGTCPSSRHFGGAKVLQQFETTNISVLAQFLYSFLIW
jgi:hypothetical protein